MVFNGAVVNAYATHESAYLSEDDPFVASDELGQPTHTVSKQEFERLSHQAKRLEHLLQVLPAGVVVINGQGVVKQSNALAKNLLGEPLEGELWRDIIARSFKPQADDGHEVSLHDGRKVKLSITPLIDEPGQLIVVTDLTETRQLQQRISHMQRLSALGKTVASLVHQIRTPLSAAILYASNLTNANLNETERGKFSHKLKQRLHELESQVNDMLLFAKSGEKQVVECVSMVELLEEVRSASESMISQAGATLSIICHQDAMLLGNKHALLGAIQNLIHNSLQMQANDPVIILSAHCDESHNYIQVVDNGPGIVDGKLAKIFEPFYTTKSQGTGLGLAVVKTVATSHGGSIKAENHADGGACFTLSIPRHKQSQPYFQSNTQVGEEA